MNRVSLLLLAGLLWAGPAAAQYRGPRSADHLFSAAAWGARALWLNPAAMGTVDEASIFLEGMVERDLNGNYPLAQYTIGFNSRGFGFGLRHDVFRAPTSSGDSLRSYGGNTWRVGFGRGLGPLAIGGTASLYSGPQTKQDVDLGLRYRVATSLDLAIGSSIGQPVFGLSLRFGGTVGLSWTTLQGILGLDAEVRAHDQETQGGYLLAYRGGVRIGIPGSLPFLATGVLELNDRFDVTRVLLGLSVGGEYLGNLVLGGREDGSNALTTASVLAQASKHFR
jgi:hypothetical protein